MTSVKVASIRNALAERVAVTDQLATVRISEYFILGIGKTGGCVAVV